MSKYRLTADAYVAANGQRLPQVHRKGAVIEYSGTPSHAMVPLDEAAIDAVAEKGPPRVDTRRVGRFLRGSTRRR